MSAFLRAVRGAGDVIGHLALGSVSHAFLVVLVVELRSLVSRANPGPAFDAPGRIEVDAKAWAAIERMVVRGRDANMEEWLESAVEILEWAKLNGHFL